MNQTTEGEEKECNCDIKVVFHGEGSTALVAGVFARVGAWLAALAHCVKGNIQVRIVAHNGETHLIMQDSEPDEDSTLGMLDFSLTDMSVSMLSGCAEWGEYEEESE